MSRNDTVRRAERLKTAAGTANPNTWGFVAPDIEQRRAQFYLNRRLRARKRQAEGKPVDLNYGGIGKYNVPTRKMIEAGVEAKRAGKVRVTLPKLNLPELEDEP